MNFEFFNSMKSTLSIFIQWFDRVGRFSDKEVLAARSIEHDLMNSSFFCDIPFLINLKIEFSTVFDEGTPYNKFPLLCGL